MRSTSWNGVVVLGASVLLALVGCEGNISSSGDAPVVDPGAGPGGSSETTPPTKIPRPGVDPPAGNTGTMDDVCRYISPGTTPLNRLTSTEYRNSVRALYPELTLTIPDVGGDERVGAFDANVVSSVLELQADLYRAASESISEQVVDQLDQVLPCVGMEEVEVLAAEAEDLTASTGQATQNAWLIWANGYVEATFTTPSSGTHTIEVLAWGTPAAGVNPQMDVVIGSQVAGQVEVAAPATAPQTYRFTTELDAGTHTIHVRFLNDFNDTANNQDRNLWVDRFTVTAGGVANVEEACVASFIDDLGPKAWRRPLTDGERDRFLALYTTIADQYGYKEGLRGVIEGALQSPQFLYRLEYGEQSEEPVTKISQYEMASRLSYFFWNAPPDEALMSAAAAGELETDAQIKAQAERMIEDPRSREALNGAVMELLGLDDFVNFDKGSAELDLEMRQAMLADTYAFIDHVLWEDDGQFETLMSADYTFVSDKTAPLYGLPAPGSQVPVKVALDDPERLGVLTHPSLLARYGYGEIPVHRGLFMRETFLCSRPNPPPDEFVDPPILYEGQPLRERAQDRLEHKGCGGCHMMMDTIGLAFDPFDAMGRFQVEDEHGNMLTATGEINFTRTTDGLLDGAPSFARALAGSDEARACFGEQWVRYALGRGLLREEDACTLQMIEQAVDREGATLQQVFVAITTTDAFRYRQTPAPQNEQ